MLNLLVLWTFQNSFLNGLWTRHAVLWLALRFSSWLIVLCVFWSRRFYCAVLTLCSWITSELIEAVGNWLRLLTARLNPCSCDSWGWSRVACDQQHSAVTQPAPDNNKESQRVFSSKQRKIQEMGKKINPQLCDSNTVAALRNRLSPTVSFCFFTFYF